MRHIAKNVLPAALLFGLAGIFLVPALESRERESRAPRVHNLQSGESFSSIQGAIDDLDTLDGHKLSIIPGTYVENLKVTKAVWIRSASGNPSDTIIQAADPGAPVVSFMVNGCTLSGFGIRNALESNGIHVDASGECLVADNEITNNYYGVYAYRGDGNTFKGNTVVSNRVHGFFLSGCQGSTMEDNFANSNGDNGKGNGVHLYFCEDLEVLGNTANWNGGSGFYLHETNNTFLKKNVADSNTQGGIDLRRSRDTVFSDNLFQGPTGGLTADAVALSGPTGGKVRFTLKAGVSNGDKHYLLLGSLTGTEPGQPLPGGEFTLPLNFDTFTGYVLASTNRAPFSEFMGVLDPAGEASALFDTRGPLPDGAEGLTFHFAFAVHGKSWDFASNAVSIQVTP